MSSLVADIRYALRVLSRNRTFTMVAVATLALGIGANTAIFSMANAILYHPFPFPDLDRMVALGETIPKVTSEQYAVSPGNYFDWVDRNHSFSQMAAYRAWDAMLTGPQGPQAVHASLVSPNFFSLLRLAPAMGRVFVEQGRENDRNQIVVSYGFWQQRLGAARDVLGRVVVLNGLGYTVIAVMPKEFDFPMYTEIWAPWITTPEQARSERARRELGVVARLRPGVSPARAQADMNGLGERLAREYPLANAGRGISVKLLRDSVDEYAGRFMAVVTGAVAFLLVLVCANVANLQLARGAGRRKEMALRIALGAGRARIARQLFTEGLLLS
ncbi:MAG TPA: ABC transporter permease, partial [Bryobacterales bacterium]|nr:ABC transporter permease [Bryobacterales bacterium]